MATKKATAKSKAKAKPKAKPEAEVEEVTEVEETEETKDETPFGVRDLCALILKKTGKEYNPREVRSLLRKMAREDEARVDREIIAGNKARYEWDGPKDPEVLAVLKAVGGGEIEAAKKEALDKLKSDKAKKAAKKTKSKAKKKKAKDADDDEGSDDDD